MSEVNNNEEQTNEEPRTDESIQDIGIPQISISLTPSSVIQQGTDATLTSQGQPADAYAVGQKFEEVEGEIGDQGTAIAELAGQVENAVLYTNQDPEPEEQSRARNNLGLGNAALYGVAADFDTTASGSKVLDAAQGAILKAAVDDLQESVSGLGAAAGYAVATDFTTDTVGTKVLDAKLGKDLNDSIAPLVSTNPGQGFGPDAQQNARNNIGAIGASDLSAAIADVVRSSSQPDLQSDEAAQRRARVNIGALGIDDAVLLTDQYNVITDNQRQIARRNIGAIAASDLASALSGMIIVQTSDLFEDYTLPSGSSGYIDADYSCPTVTGYTPLGIVGYGVYGGASTNALVYRLRYNQDNGSIRVGIRNMGAAEANLRLTVSVLYIKSAA